MVFVDYISIAEAVMPDWMHITVWPGLDRAAFKFVGGLAEAP